MSGSTPSQRVADPEAYRKKMSALVGGRDPLEIMSQTPAALRQILAMHPVERFRARPFRGKWTPGEVIGHLVDTEFVYGFRMRLILCEDKPEIHPMDQDRWVAGQGYHTRAPVELVDEFGALREVNLRLWRRMTPADLQRIGRHRERGPESLGMLLTMVAGHDLSHLDQIQRYLSAVA